MHYILSLLFIMTSITSGFAQTDNPDYDAKLAKELGADDYGMKSYIFVILKTGSNQNTSDTAFVNECFAGHLSNIKRLAKEKKLVLAGPLGKNEKTYRGLFILNVTTKEEAQELLQSDPAIAANFLAPEIYPWYGSAALPEYLSVSEKIWKKSY